MEKSLSDAIEQAVGSTLKNIDGIYMGKLIDLLKDSQTQCIQYLVVQSSSSFGTRERYFAIPASPKLLKSKQDEGVTLKMQKEELFFAKGMRGKNLPTPYFKIGQPIVEIYGYKHGTIS